MILFYIVDCHIYKEYLTMQISDIKYIEQVARAVIQAYELQTPVDLDDLVEKLGGKIINRKEVLLWVLY